MIQEQQVTSPNTSRYLNDIGLRRKSNLGWEYQRIAKKYVLKKFESSKGLLRAYSLSELGDIIPFGFFSANPVIKIHNGLWTLSTEQDKGAWETQVDAMAWYLFRLVKTKQVTVDQLNKSS